MTNSAEVLLWPPHIVHGHVQLCTDAIEITHMCPHTCPHTHIPRKKLDIILNQSNWRNLLWKTIHNVGSGAWSQAFVDSAVRRLTGTHVLEGILAI